MGTAGTDVALETADVALMADDLSKLPFAVALHAKRVKNQSISCNRWVLNLGGLNAIGIRGLTILCIFAKAIQARGYEVEIAKINPNVFQTLKDLQYHDYFSWKPLGANRPRDSREPEG